MTNYRVASVPANKMKWLFILLMTSRISRSDVKAEIVGTETSTVVDTSDSSGQVQQSSWFSHPNAIDAI